MYSLKLDNVNAYLLLIVLLLLLALCSICSIVLFCVLFHFYGYSIKIQKRECSSDKDITADKLSKLGYGFKCKDEECCYKYFGKIKDKDEPISGYKVGRSSINKSSGRRECQIFESGKS